MYLFVIPRISSVLPLFHVDISRNEELLHNFRLLQYCYFTINYVLVNVYFLGKLMISMWKL